MDITINKGLCILLLTWSLTQASVINPSLNSSQQNPDLRITDLKAGAGFLALFTFFLMGEYGVEVDDANGNIFKRPAAFEAEVTTLKDRMSIIEKASLQQGKSFRVPTPEETFIDLPPLCSEHAGDNLSNSTAVYLTRVRGSITRGLQFFEAHLNQLHTVEPAFALIAIKGLVVVDDKHGGEFQRMFPINDWITEICVTLTDGRESEACHALTSVWKARSGTWKPESLIPGYSVNSSKPIGSESEVIWGRLNGECQLALLTRCEVPYVCERTLFDANPKSQYMLTHQVLQRAIAELGGCDQATRLIDQEVNNRLCGKIYKEAQLIHGLGAPEILRDMFAEQVGVCGYMGYPNFLRRDWLDSILSWQSKSEYGCFVKDKKVGNKFLTTDKGLKRLKTRKELDGGSGDEETCLPHFTSVSLMALATYWDYMEENCVRGI